MIAYIHKYRLAFFFLFSLFSGAVNGQQQQNGIESMVYTVYREEYFFACRKVMPVDLFKVANLYVSPENGYWGDEYGVPYDGKTGSINASVKERKYTDGNIFTPPPSVADTGM
ncbi:MAG: hypothetical protein LBL79_04390 [Prevotella sp.]|jgi:hypothetical protein|nr:hypothetical protein [Prevotella sp.]